MSDVQRADAVYEKLLERAGERWVQPRKERVARILTLLDDPQRMKQFEEAQQQLRGSLQRLMVVAEKYPDLKANQNFLQLQEELSDIENKLAAARRFFNGATTEYNNAVESFPGNLIARNFGFQRELFFDLGGQFARRLENKRAGHAGASAALFEHGEHRQHKGGGLAGSGLGDAEHVAPGEHVRNGLFLNGGGRLVAGSVNRAENFVG